MRQRALAANAVLTEIFTWISKKNYSPLYLASKAWAIFVIVCPATGNISPALKSDISAFAEAILFASRKQRYFAAQSDIFTFGESDISAFSRREIVRCRKQLFFGDGALWSETYKASKEYLFFLL